MGWGAWLVEKWRNELPGVCATFLSTSVAVRSLTPHEPCLQGPLGLRRRAQAPHLQRQPHEERRRLCGLPQHRARV